MANRDLVAIGATAGDVEALSFLCTRLPANFPATILITLHLRATVRGSNSEPGRRPAAQVRPRWRYAQTGTNLSRAA
jgi:hypothetical protein